MKDPTPTLSDRRTLLSIYRHYTGDKDALEYEVLEAIQSDTVERRQAISLLMKGYSQKSVGIALGLSHGAIRSKVYRAMIAAWKKINRLPRWYVKGHQGKGVRADR